MPVSIDIYDFKCFNQLRNGENLNQNLTEFTPNLVGNIGEKVKVRYFARLMQSSFAEEGVEEWEIYPSRNEIVRSSGSFIDDGVQVGDKYRFYSDWVNRPVINPPTEEYQGEVTFISSDGTRMNYDVVSGDDTTSGNSTNIGMEFPLNNLVVYPENVNYALFLKFGLIGNDETFNYQSKVTESPQVYYSSVVTTNTVVDSESLGSIKDWVTGKATCELWAIEPDEPTASATYQITQEFVLTPFYMLAFREFIDNGTIPELLEGDSSMKYVAELEFRKTLSDTGSSKIQSFDGLNGFVGWYGENFNGLNAKYQIQSVSYEEIVSSEALEGVNINAPTRATIIVENITENITDYSCAVYIMRVPDSENDYIGTKTNMLENFLFKSEIVSSPDTAATNVTTSIVSGDLVIEYDIDYTVAEKLQLTTDDEYMLLVQVEDSSLSAGNSDRVMLIADLKNYVDVDYISGFINVESYGFLTHGRALGDTVVEEPVTSNEDGIILDAVIGTDTSRDVVINSVRTELIAYNQSENSSFLLDSYVLNIGDFIQAGGLQQIEVLTDRGYPLPVGDEFNIVKIANIGAVGGFNRFSIQVGQKIKWQEWVLNSPVDSVFFDPNEPNNNLNFKASNYSDLEGYEIKLSLVINVSGVDDLGRSLTGDYIAYGGDIIVNDYEESTDGVTGIIQTFDLDTGASLDGNVLYNGKDTLFKAVFQNAGAMIYGIHRIEPSQSVGDGILELSSLYNDQEGGLLKPLTGQTSLDFDLVGSELTTSCIIDGGVIQEGVSYKLSARVSRILLPEGFSFSFQTMALGSSDFAPSISYGGIDDPMWTFEDGTIITGESINVSPASNAGLDGTLQTVTITVQDKSLVSSFKGTAFTRLAGVIDLSVFEGATFTEIDLGLNGTVTSLIADVIDYVDGIDITGRNHDISNLVFNTSSSAILGSLVFTNNDISSFDRGSLVYQDTNLSFNNNNLTTLDVRSGDSFSVISVNNNTSLASIPNLASVDFTSNSSQFSCNQCALFDPDLPSSISGSWTILSIVGCNITQNINLTNYDYGVNAAIDIRSNLNLIQVTLIGSMSSGSIITYSISDVTLPSSTLNLSGVITGSSGLALSMPDLGITSITQGSGIIRLLSLQNNNLTGTINLSNYTLDGKNNNPINTGENTGLNSLLLTGPVLQAFSDYQFSNCNLGGFDPSVFGSLMFTDNIDQTLDLRTNGATEAQVNNWLINLDAVLPTVITSGLKAIILSDNSAPTGLGSSASFSLLLKGYLVTTD